MSAIPSSPSNDRSAEGSAAARRRDLTRAATIFACTAAAGLALAAGVAPLLDGFDRFVVLAIGSGLFTAATTFFLVIGSRLAP